MGRIFGIPTISYFDAFGALLPDALAANGLAALNKWRSLLGIQIKCDKSEVGPKTTALYLLGIFPSVSEWLLLSVSLTEERAQIRTSSIHHHLEEGTISP